MKGLDATKATGPDGLPARILKECASQFALPIARLVRQMVTDGVWPEQWRIHFVAPLHKKGAKSDPTNYWGVHMTSVLPK